MTAKFYFAEWSAAPGADLDADASILSANPSWGADRPSALNPDVIDLERSTMTVEERARERFGIFPEDETASVLAAHHWKVMRAPLDDPEPGGWMLDPVTLGVDITPGRDWTTIGAAGACRDVRHEELFDEDGVKVGDETKSLIAMEIVDHMPGAGDDVDARLIAVALRHKARVAIDPRSAAGSKIATLEAAGVEVIEMGTGDHIRAAGEFWDRYHAHLLSHRSQPELDAAVANAAKRLVGDAWLWDRRNPGVPITPLVALTLALGGHLQPAPPPKRSIARIIGGTPK